MGTEKLNDIERQNFYQTGELNEEELDAIWKRQGKKGKSYNKHKILLTSYMEKLGLLVCNPKPRLWYFFPSINKRKFVSEHFKRLTKSSILLFQFEKKINFPSIYFTNLLPNV